MWNAYAKWDRLKKALESRDLDPKAIDIDKLADVLERRGITDAKMNNVVWLLVSTLEPPGCTMTHCELRQLHLPDELRRWSNAWAVQDFEGIQTAESGPREQSAERPSQAAG